MTEVNEHITLTARMGARSIILSFPGVLAVCHEEHGLEVPRTASIWHLDYTRQPQAIISRG